jgi:hypothetical protein
MNLAESLSRKTRKVMPDWQCKNGGHEKRAEISARFLEMTN